MKNSASENDLYPALAAIIDRKIAQIAAIKQINGNTIQLTQDGKHLAVMGVFQMDGSYTIWIFGKKNFVTDLRLYIELSSR